MRLLIRLVAWNLGFIAAFAALVVVVMRVSSSAGDTMGLMLPAILAVWLLFLGALYAGRRGAVIAVAAVAGVLFAVQAALLVLLTWFSQGFGGRTHHTAVYEVLLLWVALGAPALVWWFVRAKRQPA